MLIKKSFYVAMYCLLSIALLPRFSLASKVVSSACAVVDKESYCVECLNDTPALRRALVSLEAEKKTLETKKASTLKIELCLLKGYNALIFHLSPRGGAAPDPEVEQLSTMTGQEQIRLLTRYPNNEAVLRAVLGGRGLSEENQLRAYTASWTKPMQRRLSMRAIMGL